MKIKFKQVLTNLKGETLKENNEVVTLAMVCAVALTSGTTKDPELAYALAKDIINGDELELTPAQIDFVINRLKESPLSVLLIGQAISLLK
jgi:hypothetical protein